LEASDPYAGAPQADWPNGTLLGGWLNLGENENHSTWLFQNTAMGQVKLFRVSSVQRYPGDFTPPVTLSDDSSTVILDALTGGTKGSNNPTGRIMTAPDRAAVLEAAGRAGAWLLADEVYAGAERTSDGFTPSFYGQYERVLAVNSLSKVYGLAGLRLGWVVGPVDLIHRLESRADYITICATVLANKLAAIALEPDVRERLLARARAYVRRGFDNVQTWAAERDDIEVAAPDASAICFARYHKDIGSVDLATRLAREKRVMIVPGAFFGMEYHLRLAFGMPDAYVREGLRRLGELLDEVE
jgi:aspartate/methionine/tyrosine aminotransferase